MKEFHINKYLTLRLENDSTVIYINDKKIIQCKYLLLNTNNEKDEKIPPHSNDIPIDSQIEDLNHSQELDSNNDSIIPPEVEFWAHCSNLQVWYENHYDTHVLHANLAFPLLKKLSKVGDKKAKEILKQEIIKRFRSGNLNVMTFLVKEGFLDRDHLDIEDSEQLYEELDFETLKELRRRLQDSSGKKERYVF